MLREREDLVCVVHEGVNTSETVHVEYKHIQLGDWITISKVAVE